VYLLDEANQELRIAYAVGYPEGIETRRLRVGQGVVGAAVEESRPILVNDIRLEPRYQGPLRNMLSQLAVPMRRKGRVIGALNLLSETGRRVYEPGRGAAPAVCRPRGGRD
jgi:putative methionine-R-sulfoxide reductase with GAF domain